jgi:hypothetical protein
MTREVSSADIFADRRRANPSKVDRYERVFRRQFLGAWQALAALQTVVTLLSGQASSARNALQTLIVLLCRTGAKVAFNHLGGVVASPLNVSIGPGISSNPQC